jgi:hypothetical protein
MFPQPPGFPMLECPPLDFKILQCAINTEPLRCSSGLQHRRLTYVEQTRDFLSVLVPPHLVMDRVVFCSVSKSHLWRQGGSQGRSSYRCCMAVVSLALTGATGWANLAALAQRRAVGATYRFGSIMQQRRGSSTFTVLLQGARSMHVVAAV